MFDNNEDENLRRKIMYSGDRMLASARHSAKPTLSPSHMSTLQRLSNILQNSLCLVSHPCNPFFLLFYTLFDEAESSSFLAPRVYKFSPTNRFESLGFRVSWVGGWVGKPAPSSKNDLINCYLNLFSAII